MQKEEQRKQNRRTKKCRELVRVPNGEMTDLHRFKVKMGNKELVWMQVTVNPN